MGIMNAKEVQGAAKDLLWKMSRVDGTVLGTTLVLPPELGKFRQGSECNALNDLEFGSLLLSVQ